MTLVSMKFRNPCPNFVQIVPLVISSIGPMLLSFPGHVGRVGVAHVAVVHVGVHVVPVAHVGAVRFRVAHGLKNKKKINNNEHK